MKLTRILLSSLILSAIMAVQGQNLNTLQQHLSSVQTANSTIFQELTPGEQGMSALLMADEDTKGKRSETKYEFSFADIDKNTVRALTKKDVIAVRMAVKGQQKLIRVISGSGDKVSYTDELEWYATDSENAAALEENFRAVIESSEVAESKRLSLNGYRQHLDWLLENVEAVELPSKQFIQQIETSPAPGGIRLIQDENTAKKNTSRAYELNLSILNPNSIEYKISGDEFTIYAETRRGINGIKYFEDGALKDYVKSIRIYAGSVSNGKDIYKVLTSLIPLAEEEFKKSIPNFTSAQSALDFLRGAIGEINLSESSYRQDIGLEGDVATLKVISESPK